MARKHDLPVAQASGFRHNALQSRKVFEDTIMSALLTGVCFGPTEQAPSGKEPSMKFKLLIVHGEPRGKCLLFPPGEFVIGRGRECHIRPNSDWISRQHCLLRVTRSGAIIRDLGSTNGTLVNGVRVLGERPLGDGDKVQLGQLVFEARLEESILVSKMVPTDLSETGSHSPPDAAAELHPQTPVLGEVPTRVAEAETEELPSAK
jgi:predicted component of type VI protein secretion system